MMITHKISIEVDEQLFRFHQSLLPWGERTNLLMRMLEDMRVIHSVNPSIVKDYIRGKINLLQIREELEKHG